MTTVNPIKPVESSSKNLETQTKLGIVYELFTDVNDMKYIGSTQSHEAIRLSNHKSHSKVLTRTSKLYTAMREIGADHFFIRQLEIVKFEDEQDLVRREFEIMATYNKDLLYNADTEYGKHVVSNETRIKMTEACTTRIAGGVKVGRPPKYKTDEERKAARAISVAKSQEKVKKRLEDARRVLASQSNREARDDISQSSPSSVDSPVTGSDLRKLVTQQAKEIEKLQSWCKKLQADVNLLSSVVVVKENPNYRPADLDW